MSDILLIGSGQRIGDMSMAAGERDVNIAWDKIREQLKDIGGELQGLFSGHTSGATLDSGPVAEFPRTNRPSRAMKAGT